MNDLTNRIGYIYKITSPNNRIYIGQTINLKQRKSVYKNNLFIGQIKLWNNCKKYNWKPIDTFIIIEECLCGKNKFNLNEREKYWINFYNSYYNGLNCTNGGHGSIGLKHSTETKLKMKNSWLKVNKNEFSKKCKEREKKLFLNGKIGFKKGKENISAKKIISFLKNNYIKQYDCIESVKEDNFSPSCVSKCLLGKNKQHKGYTFKYLN